MPCREMKGEPNRSSRSVIPLPSKGPRRFLCHFLGSGRGTHMAVLPFTVSSYVLTEEQSLLQIGNAGAVTGCPTIFHILFANK
jgi:hypothetical protein